MLARHGHEQAEYVEAAFGAGLKALGIEHAEIGQTKPSDWAATLDDALPKLDKLKAKDKEKLVEAMLAVVLADEELRPTELELLRVVCELIHVPLPILAPAE